MKHQNLSLVEAHSLVISKRRMIRPNTGFWTQLIEYEKKLFGKNTVTMIPTLLGNGKLIYIGIVKHCQWMIPAIDEILIWARRTKSITTARKSILKLVKLQSLVAKCCKMRKI